MTASHRLGSAARPLRVAIVGSGPAGFYAAAALFKDTDHVVEVDMFDRLPAPYGLVRFGVAPDHQKIKSVTRAYEKTARKPGFRFFGNVEVGSDLTVDDLEHHYDATIWAVGAASDRHLDVPGEAFEGSYSATEFVAWYNGHPDFQSLSFDLASVRSVVVVGIGNVAMDVTRILARDPDELAKTDITEEAVEALRASGVKNIYVLGRRGAAQVAYTPKEIEEIAELEGSDLVVRPEDAALDPISEKWVREEGDAYVIKNVEFLQQQAALGEGSCDKKVRLRLLESPVEIHGEGGKVVGISVEKNELYLSDKGVPRPRGTGRIERLDAQLVLRAVGYRGVRIPGLPYHEIWGIVPNQGGRVHTYHSNEVLPGHYVVGWAKRGPSGLVGTNNKDSKYTVDALFADIKGQLVPADPEKTADAALATIESRVDRYVSFDDWRVLDALEVEAGGKRGKIRQKFLSADEVFAALGR